MRPNMAAIRWPATAIRSPAGSTRRRSRGRPGATTTATRRATSCERPGINNWNLALFKNVAVGGRRVFQYRLEIYNLLNTVQFIDIDRTAIFNAQGQQVNANFGIANTSRQARVIQMSIRFSF